MGIKFTYRYKNRCFIERNRWPSETMNDGFEIQHVFSSKMLKAWAKFTSLSDRCMWDVFKHKCTCKEVNLCFRSSLWDNWLCLHPWINFSENIFLLQNPLQKYSIRVFKKLFWFVPLQRPAGSGLKHHLARESISGYVLGNTSTGLLFQSTGNKNLVLK